MKITVVVDKNGHVLGTYRQPAQTREGWPTLQIHGGPETTVHELDLPAELENVASANELHRRLGEHLKSRHRNAASDPGFRAKSSPPNGTASFSHAGLKARSCRRRPGSLRPDIGKIIEGIISEYRRLRG
jgi:hypothetical protein